MDATIEVSTQSTLAPNGGTIRVMDDSTAASEIHVPERMPAAIPSDQAYYWSFAWQNDIRESLAALEAGEYEDFDSDDPNDVVRWFLSDDD
jgi:hypothetical protein